MTVRVLLALRLAGIREAVLNLAHGADAVPAALGTGEALGMRLFYSREGSTAEEALETRGGLVRAMDLLTDNGRYEHFIAVAGDIVSDYDFFRLTERARCWEADPACAPAAHLVLVPNPAYHPQGDMALAPEGAVSREGAGERLTFASIGLYRADAFAGLPDGRSPLFPWLWEKRLTGEKFVGPWANVGDPAELSAARSRWTGDAGDAARLGVGPDEWTNLLRTYGARG